MPTPRPITVSLTLMVATIAAGLATRFAHLGLTPFIVKYGASALWAMMIYWVISSILSTRRIAVVALLAASISTAVELGKLIHFPSLDAFRLTLPGILLLGRFFSFWDLVAYYVAILLGALLDTRLRRVASPV